MKISRAVPCSFYATTPTSLTRAQPFHMHPPPLSLNLDPLPACTTLNTLAQSDTYGPYTKPFMGPYSTIYRKPAHHYQATPKEPHQIPYLRPKNAAPENLERPRITAPARRYHASYHSLVLQRFIRTIEPIHRFLHPVARSFSGSISNQ